MKRRWLRVAALMLVMAGGGGMIFGWGTAAQAQSSQNVLGIWQGTLDTGAIKLRLAFKIRLENNRPGGVLNSIDQGGQEIPLSEIQVHGNAIQIDVKPIFGSFEGKLSEDHQMMVGEWKQGGISFPLTLRRTEKMIELKRPQEPKKPYPYHEENVSYENKAGKNKLAGTLTLPKTGGPFPAALLITGSGQQDRNEAILGHKPFLVLADYLTRRGIAVLRVDDRGVGDSTGEVTRATSEDFAGDVLAGVEYLKSRTEIDPKKIGLIGHSEGGLIAPICAVRSPDVAFIVLMAGPGLPGDEILYRQSELILKKMGAPDAMIAMNRTAQEQAFTLVKREKDDAKAEKSLHEIFTHLTMSPTPDPTEAAATEKSEAKGDSPEAMPAGMADLSAKMLVLPWFRFFLSYDPRPTLEKVKCPVLAINGENDLQVPPKEDLKRIEEALKAGGNPDYTVKELPGLNHLFQTSQTGLPTDYGQIEETMSPLALKTMGDWIAHRTEGR